MLTVMDLFAYVLSQCRNGTERLNDIHILDTETSTWSCPHAGGVLPHPRAGMTLTALRGRLYLFGGSGTSSKCFQDLQILDRSEMAWLDVTQYESTGTGRHRYESEQQLENDDYNPRWRFGGSYNDQSGSSSRMHSLVRFSGKKIDFSGPNVNGARQQMESKISLTRF
jgi:hypothetical protein